MDPIIKKSSLIRDYWPQLTSIVMIILVSAKMYNDILIAKQEILESQRLQEKQWMIFNEKIEKTISILNDEDDGVRGDFGVGDEHIKEDLIKLEKFEDLRAEKDKLEMKVWYFEHYQK